MIVANTNAQQVAQYKYHIFDDYLLNPAYVGENNYYPVVVGRDQRFYGITGSSPETYYLTLHSRVGEGFLFEKDGKVNKFFEDFGNIALGLQMFQYSLDIYSETNIGMTYGYYLDMNQNYKRKNKRQLVLALTPRLKRVGYNLAKAGLANDGLVGGEGSFYDPTLGDQDKIRGWTFTSDIGALYKTVHGEFGVGALDFIQTKSQLESETLTINDSVSISTYDLLYPPKFLVNTKLTFVEMYNSPKFDVRFVPSVAGLYAPKTQGVEVYVDLMLEGVFKEHIAGLRSEVVVKTELGLNVYHSRVYNPTTFLQPYVTFDFQNITVQFAQSIGIDSDLTGTAGISPGSQISVLFKLANDRTIREKRKRVSWKE